MDRQLRARRSPPRTPTNPNAGRQPVVPARRNHDDFLEGRADAPQERLPHIQMDVAPLHVHGTLQVPPPAPQVPEMGFFDRISAWAQAFVDVVGNYLRGPRRLFMVAAPVSPPVAPAAAAPVHSLVPAPTSPAEDSSLADPPMSPNTKFLWDCAAMGLLHDKDLARKYLEPIADSPNKRRALLVEEESPDANSRKPRNIMTRWQRKRLRDGIERRAKEKDKAALVQMEIEDFITDSPRFAKTLKQNILKAEQNMYMNAIAVRPEEDSDLFFNSSPIAAPASVTDDAMDIDNPLDHNGHNIASSSAQGKKGTKPHAMWEKLPRQDKASAVSVQMARELDLDWSLSDFPTSQELSKDIRKLARSQESREVHWENSPSTGMPAARTKYFFKHAAPTEEANLPSSDSYEPSSDLEEAQTYEHQAASAALSSGPVTPPRYPETFTHQHQAADMSPNQPTTPPQQTGSYEPLTTPISSTLQPQIPTYPPISPTVDQDLSFLSDASEDDSTPTQKGQTAVAFDGMASGHEVSSPLSGLGTPEQESTPKFSPKFKVPDSSDSPTPTSPTPTSPTPTTSRVPAEASASGSVTESLLGAATETAHEQPSSEAHTGAASFRTASDKPSSEVLDAGAATETACGSSSGAAGATGDSLLEDPSGIQFCSSWGPCQDSFFKDPSAEDPFVGAAHSDTAHGGAVLSSSAGAAHSDTARETSHIPLAASPTLPYRVDELPRPQGRGEDLDGMLSGFGIEGDSADDISLSYLTRLEEEAEQQAAEKEKERREKEEEERVTAEATRASRLERNRSLFFPALSEAAEGHLQDVLRWRAQWKAVRSDRPDGLKRKDLGTLLPQSASEGIGWLNDEVVNEYLGSLVSRVKETRSRQSTSSVSDPPPPAWAVNSNWYNQIRTKGVASVSRWARRAKLDGERLLEAEVVLIPVNSTGNHWTLLVIRPKARSIEYLDSMGGGGSGIINAAKEYLAMTLGAKYNASEWSVETGRSPLQANGVDCGVFVCYNGLAAALGVNPTDAFTADDMARGRRVIAATLLHGSHTGPFDLPSRSRLTGA